MRRLTKVLLAVDVLFQMNMRRFDDFSSIIGNTLAVSLIKGIDVFINEYPICICSFPWWAHVPIYFVSLTGYSLISVLNMRLASTWGRSSLAKCLFCTDASVFWSSTRHCGEGDVYQDGRKRDAEDRWSEAFRFHGISSRLVVIRRDRPKQRSVVLSTIAERFSWQDEESGGGVDTGSCSSLAGEE